MKILLSNLHLKEFGGSELVTVELAEYYASLGHEVTLYSPKIGTPLLETIKRTNIKLTSNVPVASELKTFNIVWSHHGLLLDQINSFNKLPHQTIVANHMSSYVREEEPKYDPSLVDLILANSEETRQAMGAEYQVKCQLFQNPAPLTKEPICKIKERSTLLAMSVSNHRPAELLSFMLEQAGSKIAFTLYGKHTNYTRIDGKLIRQINPDFIICNGKTVQYAMEAGVPVFLYDQFGGQGWLTEENFEVNEYHNFSGRGVAKCDLKTMLNFEEAKAMPVKTRFLLPIRLGDLGLL